MSGIDEGVLDKQRGEACILLYLGVVGGTQIGLIAGEVELDYVES